MTDLKDSQELYQNCEFISKKTRSIYSWRSALWVRYCKEHKMDYTVTEDKLVDYLDWLFKIDLVNKINTKKSYVPDILRDHMGSVICLWRIQTGNNSDMVSPKEGTRYQAKWDEILRNHPRRERFQARPYLPDSGSIDAVMGNSTPGPSVHSQPPFRPGFGGGNGSSGGHRYHPRQPSLHQNPTPQRQPTQPLFVPIQPGQRSLQMHERRLQSQPHNLRTQHHQQYQQQQQRQQLVGLPEPVEHGWQLGWLLSESWAPVASRLLFSLSMSTWAEASCVVGLRLADLHFASCTMAPRLPSSVLRISLVVPQTLNSHHVLGGSGPASLTARQQDSASPSMASDGGRFDSRSASAAAESKLVSATERLSLVRELLPWDRLPVERVIRLHSLQRALSPRQQEAASHFAPLADTEPPSRLSQLCAANSGYFEHYHTIQRHKIIPPESLQNTIFPWATAMLSTIPSSARIDERRQASSFVDFLLDLRIVLLQDMAVIKCCNRQMLYEADSASILGSQLFNTPDFARFCEVVQIEAAEEIRALQHDLDEAMDRHDPYDSIGDGDAGIAQHSVGRLPLHPDEMPGPDAVSPLMPPRHSGRGSMLPESPDRESFSPTISPSPPTQGNLSTQRHSDLFAESPRGAALQIQRAPAMAAQRVQPHSLPARPLEGWGDSYFLSAGGSSANGTPGISQVPSAKRRRPELGNDQLPLLASAMPRSSSPYGKAPSPPKGHHHSHRYNPLHSHRISKSPPRAGRSPLVGSAGHAMVLARPGSTAATNTLPSIAHVVQPGATSASPMLPAVSPNLGAQAAGHERPESMRHEAEPHLPPSSLRRSSGSIDEDSSAGGVGDTTVTGRDELSRNELSQIAFLREENAYLRQRLHQLEFSVSQRQVEMENWMSRVEKFITRTSGERPL
ncbi:hypothetical protein H4R26_002715 [Coemansia thaxteri]|uniref:Ndc10 domain-containing protein n=1 Tax=Coemansia thaxteri TaxID=2663907 RepID=A0A9W8BK53_9FUNG|nr:hypothetical protein H4R26_002715 [Coemansia thaxteri]